MSGREKKAARVFDPPPAGERRRALAPAGKPYRQHVPGPDVTRIRSSDQAKRGVKPIPKKGAKR